ncbi:MAG: type VII secretion protein EssC [Clostridia bacterium]|nr:type VII secretion protein EssC [Clostridia bacterium]
MRIALIGKKHLINRELPKNIVDNYWIEDNGKKIVNIKINKENYEAISSTYSQLLDYNSQTISRIKLEENKIYPICINNIKKDIYILVCMPDYDNSFVHMDIIKTNEITIGKNSNNSIVYNNPFIKDIHARIVKFKGKWILENYDTQYGIYVNNFPVYDNTKNIFNGDVIYIMGLKIIMIKDSIYINNPDNNIKINNEQFALSKIKKVKLKKSNFIEQNDESENNVKEYYSKSPRMVPTIIEEKVQIDEPPSPQNSGKMPMFIRIGGSLFMGTMMLSSFVSVIQDIASGTASVLDIVLGLTMSIAMLMGMFIFPIIEEKWEKRMEKKNEANRQKKYRQYLKAKYNQIKSIKSKQKKIMYETYLSASECANVIAEKSPRLWERKIDDEDFLQIRLGIGEAPTQIDMSYPAEKFSLEEDNLTELLNKLLEYSREIDNAPVTMSLIENPISAIVTNDNDFVIKYMKNIILQLVTLHSYEELKLVFLLSNKNSKEWQFVKMLPHIWDNEKQIRFFADNYDDINEISQYLYEEIGYRTNTDTNEEKNIYSPYYLIITDDYKKIEDISFINEFSKNSTDKGMSLICITEDVFQLPDRCRTFIDIRKKANGILYEGGLSDISQTQFKIEPQSAIYFEKIAQNLSNTHIRIKNNGVTSLPDSFTFLEMYDVGKIEQLDIIGRWRRHDATLSLKAPIGIDSNGMIISLDAHEKYHGPHGLIAGSTGSGKSEFIITYILSLALNYHPDDVNFLLIDYKGGGLAGAFQKNDYKLPHLVGTITNIDTNGLHRSLTSIQSELRRRQVLFNKARNMTNEGTIDIYKYQKLYHDGVINIPIPHLFIICDEFAELKQQQEDFMDELMSVSRIGRSLGVHLILATQKPAGIVNDQIRSNSKFSICLKVQDTADSSDVIGKPDAAYLKNPGQFYMQVGVAEYFAIGQSGWAGAPYIPAETTNKKIDTSIEFISDIGIPIKRIDDNLQVVAEAKEDQLTTLVKYINEIAQEENIETDNLWLENIPNDIYIKDLRKKYNLKNKKNSINVVIGEYDDPSNQRQDLVTIDFMKKDNIVIYGNAESGKETLLSTMIYDLITNYTTEQVQLYILDFGSEALKIYNNSNHVGDTVFAGEDDKIQKFFEMIDKELKNRKEILSDYNGDYNLYIAQGNIMPMLIVVINSYESFNEISEERYEDMFSTLTRDGTKCGIVFVISVTASTDLRYRLAQNFGEKFALLLNNEDEYISIFDKKPPIKPIHIFGRGLVNINDNILEFQTAKICEHSEYNTHIKNAIEATNSKNPIVATSIPTLPKLLKIQDLSQYLTDITEVPIGMIKANLNIYTYDFVQNSITIVVSKNMNDAIEYANNIINIAKKIKNVNILSFDPEKVKGSLQKELISFVEKIENAYNGDEEQFTLCLIIGLNKIIASGIFEDEDLNTLFSFADENDNNNLAFIIVENPNFLNDYNYDSWYSEHIKENCGIWVGSGVENQSLISTNFNIDGLENDCGRSFGYIILDGDATLVKLLGMKEEGDE